MSANRMLIIDDEPALGQLFARAAIECGYEAFFTSDAEEFRNRVHSWVPSHIVLDLNMPGVDGIEVLRFLASERSTAQIVIASGFDLKVVESARKLGTERGLSVVETIRKPIRADELRRIFSDLRDEDDWLTEEAIIRAVNERQFFLAYQPKVRFVPEAPYWNDVYGFEALIRWRHPVRGEISPVEFIPAAEGFGVIDRLTDNVFDLAFAQVRAWTTAGHGFTVSVNVSAENLHEADFVDQLVERCQDSGVRPENFVIELTETAAMGDVALAMDILTRLRIKGFSLAMDDFGTGYSSLVQLQQLPFSELKIDRAFIKEIHKSVQSKAIANAMINLGHNLDLSVVAEGIDDPDAMRILAELNCDIAQGFLISKPMTAERVDEWLKTIESAPGPKSPASHAK